MSRVAAFITIGFSRRQEMWIALGFTMKWFFSSLVAALAGLGWYVDGFIQTGPRHSLYCKGHPAVELSENGQLVVTKSIQGWKVEPMVQIWNSQTGEEITRYGSRNLRTHIFPEIPALVWQSNAKGQVPVGFMNLQTGAEWHYDNPGLDTYQFGYEPGSKVLFLVGNKGCVFLDPHNGRVIGAVPEVDKFRAQLIQAGALLLFSPTKARENSIHWWDFQAAKSQRIVKGARLCRATPDGTSLVIEENKDYVLWNVAQDRKTKLCAMGGTFIWHFSPNGEFLACMDYPEHPGFAWWEVATGRRLGKVLPTQGKRKILDSPFSPDSAHLGYFGEDGAYCLVDSFSEKVLWSKPFPLGYSQPIFTPDGLHVLLNGRGLAETHSGRWVHEGDIYPIDCSNNLHFLLRTLTNPTTGTTDHVLVFSLPEGREIARLKIPKITSG